MNINNAEKIIESGKKYPWKTLLKFVLALMLVGIFAFVAHYCGEKGKQLAEPPKISNETIKAPNEKQQKMRDNDQPKDNLKIKQHTEGDQSPAIVSNGDVEIEYGDNK